MMLATLDAVPPLQSSRRGRLRCRPDKLRADKSYDARPRRHECRTRGIVPRIARRGIESSEKPGRHRWVVELYPSLVQPLPAPSRPLRPTCRHLRGFHKPRDQPRHPQPVQTVLLGTLRLLLRLRRAPHVHRPPTRHDMRWRARSRRDGCVSSGPPAIKGRT